MVLFKLTTKVLSLYVKLKIFTLYHPVYLSNLFPASEGKITHPPVPFVSGCYIPTSEVVKLMFRNYDTRAFRV